MGRNIIIDHRNVDREKAAPKIVKPSTGIYAPAMRETPYETEEIKQLKAQIVAAEGRASQAEAKFKTKNAELTAMHGLLKASREGSQNLRKQLAEIDTSGKVPAQVEVVDVDDMLRRDDVAVLQALCSVDGVVGNTEIILPVAQLKAVLKSKRQKDDE